MADRNIVESAVDDPDDLLLRQMKDKPVFCDKELQMFVNMPPQWKELMEKLQLTASDEIDGADDIITALKFYQINKAHHDKKEKFMYVEAKDQVTHDGSDETDHRVVGREVRSKHMSVTEFITKMEPLLGKEDALKKYKLYHAVGKGATATVYHGLNNYKHNDVAVKEMVLACLHRKDLVYDEIDMMTSIKHDNIVNYLECFIIKGNTTLWLVMEYLDGGSLSNVAFYTSMQEFQVAHIVNECLKGLSYLHDNNIIHRDVKSDNVLLGFNGAVKLTDFGFCARLEDSRDLRTSHVGTLYWMAPEVVKDKPYNCKIDIWSLGVLLVEMIDGQPPYCGESQFRTIYLITTNPKPPVKEVHRFSREATSFLDCCFHTDVTKRWTAHGLLRHPFVTKQWFQDFHIKDNILFARQKHRALTHPK